MKNQCSLLSLILAIEIGKLLFFLKIAFFRTSCLLLEVFEMRMRKKTGCTLQIILPQKRIWNAPYFFCRGRVARFQIFRAGMLLINYRRPPPPFFFTGTALSTKCNTLRYQPSTLTAMIFDFRNICSYQSICISKQGVIFSGSSCYLNKYSKC